MRELNNCQKIEQSITKKYRKKLWTPFINAIKQYELIKPNDNIAVCISGGKDSMLLAKLLQLLQRISDIEFNLKFLVMDPGYSEKNREQIINNAKLLEIPIEIFESDIFDVANSVTESPCYLCARMRRGHLYAKAKSLNCNKIALGHHMSDVIETTLIGMFYGSQLQAMMPKLHSKNFEGMELIRPLYCINENDIISWKEYNSLTFLQCACKFTEKIADPDHIHESKRKEVKLLIAELKKTNKDIEKSLFNSIHSVCLDTFPCYKTKGQTINFLDNYDNYEG